MGFVTTTPGSALAAWLVFVGAAGCSPPEPGHPEATPEPEVVAGDRRSELLLSEVVGEVEEREKMEAAASEANVQQVTLTVVETPRGSITIGANVRITGNNRNDTELLIPIIDAWDAGPQTGTFCELEHRTPVRVIAATYLESEDRYYFNVIGADCGGWVSESLVQP